MQFSPRRLKDKKQYDVFISHANEDTDWCKQLAEDLRDARLRVWFDKWQIRKPGTNLIDEMEKGLARSRRAILVFTPKYVSKKNCWARAERCAITYIHFDSVEHRGFAIPLLLKDCKLSLLWVSQKYLDFRNEALYQTNLQELIDILRDESPANQTPRVKRLTLSN